jgi:hypothetical protein
MPALDEEAAPRPCRYKRESTTVAQNKVNRKTSDRWWEKQTIAHQNIPSPE